MIEALGSSMRPAILVIDMLKEFVYGRLKSPYAANIVPVIKSIIERARSQNIPVIYLADRHLIFDNELRIWGPHAMSNDPESEIIEELKPTSTDLVLHKRSYSGFRETGLEYVLRDLGVDTVVLTGIHTHICVLHTAIDAFYARFRLLVVEDAVAAFSREDHDYAIRYMRDVLGAKVVKSHELFELFDSL